MNPLPSQPSGGGSNTTVVIGGSNTPTFHTHPPSSLTAPVGDDQLPERLGSTTEYVTHLNNHQTTGWWAADILTAQSPDITSFWSGVTYVYGRDTTALYATQIAFETQPAGRLFQRTCNAGTWGDWVQMDRAFYDARYAPATESVQDVQSADVTPNGTTPSALTGLSIAVTSPGTSAVYMVTIDADVTFVGSQTNLIELLVDGVAESAQLISGAAASGYRINGSKMWRITGLAAGSRTFTAQTKNSGAGTNATVKQTHTLMTVQRVA